MSGMTKNRHPLTLRALTVALGVAVSSLAPVALAADQKGSAEDQLNLFNAVFERIQSQYVEQVGAGRLVQTAVEGMLTSIDPESGYLDPAHIDAAQSSEIPGDIPELGLVVTLADGVVQVIAPLDGGPAQEAGLRPRDRIVAIDNVPVSDQSLPDAVAKLRGPADSKVKIFLQRGSTPPSPMELTRKAPSIPAVTSRMDGAVAVIRLPKIAPASGAQVLAALSDLRKQRKEKFQGIVLDLRRDPGGSVDGAVAVANLFMRQGTVVTVRKRNDQAISEVKADSAKAAPADIIGEAPTVVLIDGGTSGAAEIIAGALQANRRAVIAGTRSFGKGTVHSLIKLSDGGALRLATARYVTPAGATIEGKGISPDIEVLPARLDVMAEGYAVSEAKLRGALSNPTTAAKPAADKPTAAAAAPVADQGDYQLSRAIDLVRGIAIYAQAAQSAN